MAESGQQSDAPVAVRSSAPSPRKKVTISLTAAQAADLRVLWQEHSAALHAMLTSWCGNPQNASDLLQEVFRRLAESPAIMGKMKNARAFLAVSARRLAVDFSRRSATRVAYQAAAGAEVPVVQNPGPTDENLRAAIKEALEGLPAEQRAVVEHKVLKGRTLNEIARLEAVSLNTAASRLRYALDKIRGQLRPYYDDLNRSQFKNMKNDLNQDLSENKRIITPLEPKRVPSVVPGLEGLAALSTDAGVSDVPAPEQAECYALPEVEAPAPEFVEPRVHVDPVFFDPPTSGIDPASESVEEQAPEVNIDGSAGEIPELVSCEMFPPDGEIPDEWLRPIELPEDFFVTVFEGEGGSDTGDEVADGEGAPLDFESGFEICVLPVPEDFAAEMDPREYLVRYDAFLSENPDWGALDPDVMEAQVITASNYFSELEFGAPSKAAAFDSWYEAHYLGGGSPEGDGGAGSDPSDDSASLGLAEFMRRYDTFLADNPSWVQDNQGGDIQLQVITASVYFADLEFGTPGEAQAFDLWYEAHYNAGSQAPDEGSADSTGDFAGGTAVTGGKVLDGNIPPHWRSGGDASEPVYSLTSGGSGLVLGGGTAETGAGILSNPGLSLDGRSGDFPGQTVIAGGEVQIDPSLIWQFDPSRWEGTGLESRVAELMRAYDPTAQSASEEVQAPVTGLRESGNAEDSGTVGAIEPMVSSTEPAGAVAQASVGKAPAAPSEVLGLPVEIAAAEISNVESATSSGDFVSAVSAAQGVHSPNAEPGAASLGAAVDAKVDLAPHDLAAAGGDFIANADADVSQDAVADAPLAQKHDSTTVAAGAVAVGGVAHGSGAAAAAARKPLPQI